MLFYTVSNVENMLGVHEYKGHLIGKLGKDKHWLILELQKNDYTWKKTTKDFKALYEDLQTDQTEYRKPK